MILFSKLNSKIFDTQQLLYDLNYYNLIIYEFNENQTQAILEIYLITKNHYMRIISKILSMKKSQHDLVIYTKTLINKQI